MKLMAYTLIALMCASALTACQSDKPTPSAARMEGTLNGPLGSGDSAVCDDSQNVC